MSELLDISTPRLGGRPRKLSLQAEVLRELGPADIALLEVNRATKAPALLRLKDSHHRLAQSFANGFTPAEAGAQTGYSQSRISILLADKSFQDLVEVYRLDGAALRAEYADLATANMITSERILGDSLQAIADSEEPVELSSLRPLLDIISDRADRFGYPKNAINTNVNVEFAGALEKARRRAGITIDAPTGAAAGAKATSSSSPLPSPAATPVIEGSSGSAREPVA